MTTTTQPRFRPPVALGALLLATGLGLAGCAGGADPMSESAGSTSEQAEAESASEPDALSDSDAGAASPQSRQAYDAGSTASGADRAVAVETEPATEPLVIQTGTLTVTSDDVARARFDLDKVLDTHGGSIADEKTTATSEGEVRLSRLELRVPSGEFDAAMDDLGELGKVTASTRKAQDVTGEVIDTRARIRAQEQSLQRVEILFTRAQDIRDIVAIEAQLSRRQAELDSLKGQLAYLEDQTSLSTITVYLEQAEQPDTRPEEPDDNAFLGGLQGGWQALTALGAGLATVAGALLPFTVVALVLGLPLALLVRRWLSRHPWRRPAAEA